MANPLTIDRDNRKLLGVCAGLARSFGVGALWVRLAFVASVLLGFGLSILLYFVIALLAD